MSYEIDWIKSRSDLFPNKCAVIDSAMEDSWTYQELNERASRLAGFLLRRESEKATVLPYLLKIMSVILIFCLPA